MRGSRARGFTLLEILVAIAVFAVVAWLAYGGLRQVLAGRAMLLPRMEATAARLRGITLLERDITSAAPRGVRDPLGTPQPAFRAEPGGRGPLALVRHDAARALLAGEPALSRVEWQLEGNRLVRLRWPVLDPIQGTQPLREIVLTGVRQWQLEFLAGRKDADWKNFWPPDAAGVLRDQLPRAVVVTLVFDDGAALRRLLPVPGGGS